MATSSRDDELNDVADLFGSLSSPVRIAIIEALFDGEKRVSQLADLLHHAQPLISQHLRILRNAGLVKRFRTRGELHYALTDDHVTHIVKDALTHTRESRASHGKT